MKKNQERTLTLREGQIKYGKEKEKKNNGSYRSKYKKELEEGKKPQKCFLFNLFENTILAKSKKICI